MAALAVVGFVSLAAARAQQETWQPARAGASTWGAGQKTNTAQTATGRMTGGSSGWIAGRGSFGSSLQPGGVWQGSLGGPVSTSPAITKNTGNGNLQPGSALNKTNPAPKLASLHPAPATVRTAAAQGKAQGSRASGAARSSTGPHFGVAGKGRSGAFKSTSAHAKTAHSRSGSGTGTHSGSGSPAPGPLGSNPFATTPSSGAPGLGAPGGLDGTLH
ncbi:MAG: hypothetical protein ABSF23_01770 [Terracidiphilus sp.]